MKGVDKNGSVQTDNQLDNKFVARLVARALQLNFLGEFPEQAKYFADMVEHYNDNKDIINQNKLGYVALINSFLATPPQPGSKKTHNSVKLDRLRQTLNGKASSLQFRSSIMKRQKKTNDSHE